jgi:hypothetical protein
MSPTPTRRSGPTVLYAADPTTAEPPSSDATTPITVLSIDEIVVSRRSEGATLVRFTLSGDLAQRHLRHRRDPGDPARHILVVLGLEVTDAPRSLPSNDPILVGVALVPIPGFEAPVTEIRLDLVSSAVEVGQIAVSGPHLVIELLAVP